jgi:hypothetical protein
LKVESGKLKVIQNASRLCHPDRAAGDEGSTFYRLKVERKIVIQDTKNSCNSYSYFLCNRLIPLSTFHSQLSTSSPFPPFMAPEPDVGLLFDVVFEHLGVLAGYFGFGGLFRIFAQGLVCHGVVAARIHADVKVHYRGVGADRQFLHAVEHCRGLVEECETVFVDNPCGALVGKKKV